MAFSDSTGHGVVVFRSAVCVEAGAVVFRSAGAAVVGIGVGRGVAALVDGAAVVGAVVAGRGVVVRTVGAVTAAVGVRVGVRTEVGAFDTIVEVVSADRPATVGRVVCDTDGEEGVLTVWAAAPQVEAGGAA